ncbi:hypothetical protein TVAG_356440 [Trichomonas vaginalis G3]|uniref:Uncharacterized protein n=1 Tax=Trichomonas vaginalis (strain ATCC PRA-98 / G3) TaxID=412133 RepID=A2FM63_TRIV3|nr:hypothetical protein TVAGG3_0152660 [Trichomonas vaginalis G3]EAX93997.1 hypothetical protein TVAG_356440 [Trichomonas vaginalis G3]KAI5547381.1 hypothetical protein TVAGG3_0152660 [Trichomonas vaginalis G3]|eukprot:XP_001306927.1 hypothetical protein [Trichomonas vaginalis G3]
MTFDLVQDNPNISLTKPTKSDISFAGSKVIILGNPEFGKNGNVGDSITAFSQVISQLIQENGFSDVFILGKLFDSQLSSDLNEINLLSNVISQINCKFHILPSSQEQRKIQQLPNSDIDYIKTLIASFTKRIDSGPINFCFTHNIGNEIVIAEDAGCNFLMFLKNCYRNAIGVQDFLISSYVDGIFVDFMQKVASTGTFLDSSSIGYLILDFQETVQLEVVSTILPGKSPQKKSQPANDDDCCCKIC